MRCSSAALSSATRPPRRSDWSCPRWRGIGHVSSSLPTCWLLDRRVARSWHHSEGAGSFHLVEAWLPRLAPEAYFRVARALPAGQCTSNEHRMQVLLHGSPAAVHQTSSASQPSCVVPRHGSGGPNALPHCCGRLFPLCPPQPRWLKQTQRGGWEGCLEKGASVGPACSFGSVVSFRLRALRVVGTTDHDVAGGAGGRDGAGVRAYAGGAP